MYILASEDLMDCSEIIERGAFSGCAEIFSQSSERAHISLNTNYQKTKMT